MVFLILPCPAKGGQASNNDNLNKILHWLPADSETLVVYRRPFTIQSLNQSEGLPEEFADSLRSRLVRLPLPMQRNQIIPRSFLEGKIISLQVEAGKHFRSANAAAKSQRGTYQSCSVTVFNPDGTDSLNDAFVLARQCAKESFFDQGYEVLVLPEYDNVLVDAYPLDFYFCSPSKSGILVCATSKEIMHEVLSRMKNGNRRASKSASTFHRAFPDEWPEWTLVNREADIWALRHYDRANAPFDLSSAYYLGTVDKSTYRDEAASGIVFEYSKSQGQAKINYLSNDSQAQEVRKKAWRDSSEQVPEYDNIQSGSVLTVSFDVDGAIPGKRRALALLVWHLLGYATVL